MKILITGGAGFVGSNLALKLKDKYPTYEVLVFDNLKRRGSELNLSKLQEHEIAFHHGDIRNTEDLESVGGFDVMIDASAEPSVTNGLDSKPNYMINNNLLGSINCFNSCLDNNAKLVFLSTSRVYPIERIEKASYVEEASRFSFAEQQTEAGISPKGISEELDLWGARSFYGSTKLSAEYLLQEYSEFYGLKAAITRFGVIAGPRQMGKTDQGVATLWMARHFWKKELKYIGYGGLGKQVRDILHIEDVFGLIDLQLHQIDQFNKKVFNAGGGIKNSISLQEMTQLCQEISGNKIKVGSEMENRPADLRMYITDNSKIEKEVPWKPKKKLEEIFGDIYEWIRSNEDELAPLLR